MSRLEAADLVFDGFHVRRDSEGIFQGSADFIAPMPADGRNVVYTVTYALQAFEDGRFAGTETITEDGGASLDCPVELVFVAA